MGKPRLTKEQCLARYEAYLECAEHLNLDWTDDVLEFQEGTAVSRWLASEADRWHRLAARKEHGEMAELAPNSDLP